LALRIGAPGHAAGMIGASNAMADDEYVLAGGRMFDGGGLPAYNHFTCIRILTRDHGKGGGYP